MQDVPVPPKSDDPIIEAPSEVDLPRQAELDQVAIEMKLEACAILKRYGSSSP